MDSSLHSNFYLTSAAVIPLFYLALFVQEDQEDQESNVIQYTDKLVKNGFSRMVNYIKYRGKPGLRGVGPGAFLITVFAIPFILLVVLEVLLLAVFAGVLAEGISIWALLYQSDNLYSREIVLWSMLGLLGLLGVMAVKSAVSVVRSAVSGVKSAVSAVVQPAISAAQPAVSAIKNRSPLPIPSRRRSHVGDQPRAERPPAPAQPPQRPPSHHVAASDLAGRAGRTRRTRHPAPVAAGLLVALVLAIKVLHAPAGAPGTRGRLRRRLRPRPELGTAVHAAACGSPKRMSWTGGTCMARQGRSFTA